MKYKIIILSGVVLLLIGGFSVWKHNVPQAGLVGKGEDNSEMIEFEDEEKIFIFKYPKEYIITESTIEGIEEGKLILVEGNFPRSGLGDLEEGKLGFEIIIIPFEEEGQLTKERILMDLPDLQIINDKKIFIGNNIEAFEFESEDDNIGQTYEVWFVNKKYLYQVRTYAENKNELNEILKTFKLN